MKSRLVHFALPILFSVIFMALVVSSIPHTSTYAQTNFDCATVTEISQLECEALVALYNATDGPNWHKRSNWLETNTPCNWEGIICHAGSTEVINLSDNNLKGALPPEIGNLSPNWLYLNNNKLTSLPPEIGNLSDTAYLLLENNLLTSLPSEIGKLDLYWLHLNDNQLTSLPQEFSNLSAHYLHLENNQLTSLPLEISSLDVAYLYLSNNQLTSLPPQIGSLYAHHLDLSNNQLTSFPASSGNANLTYLYLDNNRLTSLPPQIGSYSQLGWLGLSNNRLTSLPPEIGNLSQLHYLYLNDNQLTSLPPEIGNFGYFYHLDLGNNQLTALPSEIGNLAYLATLYLGNNQLTGLPPEMGNLAQLHTLHLNDNQLLSGAIPVEMTNLANLKQLVFYNTAWCVPETPLYTNWLAVIPSVYGTGLVCDQPAGAMSGIASGAGDPLPTGQVELYRFSPTTDLGFSWVMVDSTAVDAEGRFIFENLGQGIDYYAYFWDTNGLYIPEYYDDIRFIEMATPITATLGITRTGIDADLWLYSMNRYLPMAIR